MNMVLTKIIEFSGDLETTLASDVDYFSARRKCQFPWFELPFLHLSRSFRQKHRKGLICSGNKNQSSWFGSWKASRDGQISSVWQLTDYSPFMNIFASQWFRVNIQFLLNQMSSFSLIFVFHTLEMFFSFFLFSCSNVLGSQLDKL